VPLKIRGSGETLVARFTEIEDRDQALRWVGALIHVPQACLPKLAVGEYYWTDLIGLAVENLDGVELGVITEMLATGSNDVMVVRGERERMLPYLPGQFVLAVDLAARKVKVDWDPEF
jgi:16S rRNA processing protein RimM